MPANAVKCEGRTSARIDSIMAIRPILIGNEIYRRLPHGPRHSLSVPRVSACMDLCRALGWLDDDEYRGSSPASLEQILTFHEPEYLDALQRIEVGETLTADEKVRFNIGVNGNPVFPEIFTRPATACGATLAATEIVETGGIVFSPAGGTHHGRPGRASGSCYLNDLAIGIGSLLTRGSQPILYLDIDAHHGDGVQDAFHDDDRVLTVSIHEAGRWPRTGEVEDCGGGFALNLPAPPGFNDSEMDAIMERVISPLAHSFAPEIILLQCGADGLRDDPMSKLDLSNNALWSVVSQVSEWSDRVIVFGGGGLIRGALPAPGPGYGRPSRVFQFRRDYRCRRKSFCGRSDGIDVRVAIHPNTGLQHSAMPPIWGWFGLKSKR